MVSPDQEEQFEDLREILQHGYPVPAPSERFAKQLQEQLLAILPAASRAKERRYMKTFARLAVAASVLAAAGFLVCWVAISSSPTFAFAEAAKVLDGLRSATYDVAWQWKAESGQGPGTATGKGYFLAPSRERTERGPDGKESISISDQKAAKSLLLFPEQKFAMVVDTKKMTAAMEKSADGLPPNRFETMRRLVREGCSGKGEKTERLGTKEIDGHTAIGFQTHSEYGEMTYWADPKTGRPVRIEHAAPGYRMVMSHFRCDVDLAPALFSLEPPAGYTTQTMDVSMPDEGGLIAALRMIAEHNNGMFPEKLGQTKEINRAMQAGVRAEAEKVAAKYGGYDKLMAKYGKDLSAVIMPEVMKAAKPWMRKMQGMGFYLMLKPENDAHYAGGGVKLDTPDRPIFWYKPTGSKKYRVLYADLRIKDAAPAEVKNFAKAAAPTEDDLIKALRLVAQNNGGTFPMAIRQADEGVQQAVRAAAKPEMEKLIKPIVEKYGEGAKGRKEGWPEMLKAGMPPLQKYMRQVQMAEAFYTMLQPENDAHYAGQGVKLDTPDRPIFWYKPTGSEEYRVLYADLSVREISPAEAKKLSGAKPQ
jgi:outer membrane lipoprotein-sorting protein